MSETPLFDRLGGRDGIRAVSEKILANHLVNPVIKNRYAHAQQTQGELLEHVVEFFCTGLTGVETYKGRPIPDAHTGMNVSPAEFVAVLDDVVDAMKSEDVGELEQAEVLAILYGMKSDVVGR